MGLVFINFNVRDYLKYEEKYEENLKKIQKEMKH